MELISKNRIKRDIKQLKSINCNLKIINNKELTFDLKGPKDSLYEHGKYNNLPEELEAPKSIDQITCH